MSMLSFAQIALHNGTIRRYHGDDGFICCLLSEGGFLLHRRDIPRPRGV